jgi:hypothetical protein
MNHPSFPKKTSGFFQKVSEFSMEFSMENSSFCPLVGGFNPSEKYEFVSWDDDNSQYMESHKIPWFQSPPTGYDYS